MRKNKEIKKNHGLIIIIAFILLFATVVYWVANTNKAYPPQTNSMLNTEKKTKIFRSSSVMKFTIIVPYNYEVVEKLGSVNISTNNNEEILIGRNGTNFDNLGDYIKNSRNNLANTITDRKELVINGLESMSGKIGSEKTYFIYAANFVYILSTSSSALFPALDKIAQSFRYTP